MRRAILLTLFLAAAFPAQAADSAYTKLDFDTDCKPIAEDELGGAWICAGYKEWQQNFAEGDLRQSVFYGELGPWFEKGAFESFSQFNHAGDTIEWRLHGGVPYATIRRWFVQGSFDDSGNAGPEVQVLVVSKVGQIGVGDACVVGYVEASANRNANVLARDVADTEARKFVCRVDVPLWHGARKNEEVQESRSFGE